MRTESADRHPPQGCSIQTAALSTADPAKRLHQRVISSPLGICTEPTGQRRTSIHGKAVPECRVAAFRAGPRPGLLRGTPPRGRGDLTGYGFHHGTDAYWAASPSPYWGWGYW